MMVLVTWAAACSGDFAAPAYDATVPADTTAAWSDGPRIEDGVARAVWGFHCAWSWSRYSAWATGGLAEAGFRIGERTGDRLTAVMTLEADVLYVEIRGESAEDGIEVRVELTGTPW